MNMKKAVMLFVFLTVYAAAGVTYSLKESVSGIDFDWTYCGNYTAEGGGEAEAAPGEGDTVVIPFNVHAKLDASSPSFALVTKLKRVTPKGGSIFEITVPEGQKAELGCAVSFYKYNNETGKLLKRGAGTLTFAGYKKVMDGSLVKDYYTNIDVQEGKLELYQGGTSATEYFYSCDVHVAEGAELALCRIGYSYLRSLTGDGSVTKAETSDIQRTYLSGAGHHVFGGVMRGKQIRVDIINGRHDFLCPTNDISTIILGAGTFSGMTNFGTDNDSLSSLGTGNVNFTGSGNSGVICLNDTPYTCAKTWWWVTLCRFDAGAFGGIDFSGMISPGYNVNNNLYKLMLSGSNTQECVISGKIADTTTSNGKYEFIRFYVEKTGTGAWRFPAVSPEKRRGIGIIDVQEGTLRFDSIAEKGLDSSIGMADYLFPNVYGSTNNVAQEKYAFILGGRQADINTATEGVLEYSGEVTGAVSTRPIAIRSRGRIKNEHGAFSFVGAYARGGGECTLALDSPRTSGHANMASGLSDGEDGGKLSVVKEGSGDYLIYGTNTCTGSLFAKGGRIILKGSTAGRKYRWYRFVVTENAYSCSRYDTEYSTGTNKTGAANSQSSAEKAQVQITELALYDKDGNNLVKGFTQKTPITQFAFNGGDARIMDAGEIAIGSLSPYGNFTHPSQALANMVDCAGNTATGYLQCGYDGIRQDDPSTWMPIVVRLPDDAPQAVRFDFACGRNRDGDYAHLASYNGRNPTAYRLDASVDGLNWDIGIASNTAIEVPEIYPKWDSEPDKGISYATPRKDKGTVISDAEVKSGNAYAFSSVGAANGATVTVDGEPIEINGLRVDASQGSGNIENVILAENGTVEIVNFDEGRREISFPVNVAGLSESGVSAWKVNINGKPSNWKCTVTKDDRIRITPAGMYLIVR